jgi:shikimate kinase
MDKLRSNIALIGMPGAGKSTIGVILAKMTSRDFVDTDLLIQGSHGRSLQNIVNSEGYMALRSIEEEILLGLNCDNCVIATGGSAVYSGAAMAKLSVDGLIVYLKTDLATLEQRALNVETRGLARRPGQSFADLYLERLPLYERYAEITVEAAGRSHEEICLLIIEKARNRLN